MEFQTVCLQKIISLKHIFRFHRNHSAFRKAITKKGIKMICKCIIVLCWVGDYHDRFFLECNNLFSSILINSFLYNFSPTLILNGSLTAVVCSPMLLHGNKDALSLGFHRIAIKYICLIIIILVWIFTWSKTHNENQIRKNPSAWNS